MFVTVYTVVTLMHANIPLHVCILYLCIYDI